MTHHCDAHLSGGPLTCTRDQGHDGGHVYAASWAADAHTESEARDE